MSTPLLLSNLQTAALDPSDVRALVERIAVLEADNLRLRAAVLLRDSAVAFARQDCEAMAASVPGLPRRVELARRVEALGEKLQSMLRERPQPGRLQPGH